jgi:tRNA(adenine34) deaminase
VYKKQVGKNASDQKSPTMSAEAATKRTLNDEKFMRRALKLAMIGKATLGGAEVGCVIVSGGRVLAAGFNEEKILNDPTAHAEIVTLRRLGATLKTTEFRGMTLYCTLQCCTMCTVACIWSKVSRIVYGATRKDVHSMYFDTRDLNTADLVADAFKDDTEVVGGVLKNECAALYVGADEFVPISQQSNR